MANTNCQSGSPRDSLISIDRDHTGVATTERQGNFAEDGETLVQAGQVCNRSSAGSGCVMLTSMQSCGGAAAYRK